MFTLLERALADATRIIDTIVAGDFHRPTPCADWDLQHLLTHLLGELNGFTLAVASGDAPTARFRRTPIEPEQLAHEWQQVSSGLLTAFAAADLVAVVRLGDYGPLPVEVVLRMQLLDTAVHNWDLATTLGQDYHPCDATAGLVRDFAERIVARQTPTSAFAPPTKANPDTDPWPQALHLLGRSPGVWDIHHVVRASGPESA